MNCPQCQAPNGPDAVFCGSCGARQSQGESATPLGNAPSAASSGYGQPSDGGYGAPAQGGYGSSASGYGPASYDQPGQPSPDATRREPVQPRGQYQPEATRLEAAQPPGQYQPDATRREAVQPGGQYQPEATRREPSFQPSKPQPPSQPQPDGQYQPPQGSWQSPQGGWQSPQDSFQAPQDSYQSPQGSYQSPQGSYQAPAGGSPQGGGFAPPPGGGYQPAPGQYPPQGQYSPQGQFQQPTIGGGYQPARTPTSVPPVSFDLNRLTSVDRIVASGSLIALISVFLPWYHVSDGGFGSFSYGGTDLGHGWFWLEFFVALVLIAYLATRAAWAEPPVRLPIAHAPLLLVGTALQLLLVLVNFIFIPYANEGDGWDWGAFIGLLAAVAAAAPVVVPAVRSYRASRTGTGTGTGRPF